LPEKTDPNASNPLISNRIPMIRIPIIRINMALMTINLFLEKCHLLSGELKTCWGNHRKSTGSRNNIYIIKALWKQPIMIAENTQNIIAPFVGLRWNRKPQYTASIKKRI
jgi:hypothetical protein